MATAMDQDENYLRLSQLIIRVGTKFFRMLLDYWYPGSSLRNKLSEFATEQRLHKVLLKCQFDLVYPAPKLFKESRDFDIGLLSQLLKTLCSTQLPAPPSGWYHPPSEDDLSVAADIVRIDFCRKDIVHKFFKGELRHEEFVRLWKEAKDALLRIAHSINGETRLECDSQIIRLSDTFDPLTPDAKRDAMQLKEMDHRDMIIQTSLTSAEEKLRNFGNKVEQLQELLRNRAPSSSSAEGGGQFKEEIVLL